MQKALINLKGNYCQYKMKCISVQGKNGVQLYTGFMAFIYQKKANISLELYILIENV